MLKEVLHVSKDSKWTKKLREDVRRTGNELDIIAKLKVKEIKEIMRVWDEKCWREKMSGKTSMELYQSGEKTIKEGLGISI